MYLKSLRLVHLVIVIVLFAISDVRSEIIFNEKRDPYYFAFDLPGFENYNVKYLPGENNSHAIFADLQIARLYQTIKLSYPDALILDKEQLIPVYCFSENDKSAELQGVDFYSLDELWNLKLVFHWDLKGKNWIGLMKNSYKKPFTVIENGRTISATEAEFKKNAFYPLDEIKQKMPNLFNQTYNSKPLIYLISFFNNYTYANPPTPGSFIVGLASFTAAIGGGAMFLVARLGQGDDGVFYIKSSNFMENSSGIFVFYALNSLYYKASRSLGNSEFFEMESNLFELEKELADLQQDLSHYDDSPSLDKVKHPESVNSYYYRANKLRYAAFEKGLTEKAMESIRDSFKKKQKCELLKNYFLNLDTYFADSCKFADLPKDLQDNNTFISIRESALSTCQ
jgi:hypothetical protein